MSKDLATRAELVKLARVLHTGIDCVAFAESLSAADIRELREGISASLYDEHRDLYQRIAAASKLLPSQLTAKIAERAFPPVISAGVSAELSPERAADLANRMPVGYLADVCVGLDPRKVAPIIERIPVDRAIEVASELVSRDEHLTLGRMIDAATDEQLRAVAARISSDGALLWIGFYAESPEHLTHAIRTLPDERIRSIVHTALEGSADLHSAGLMLMGRIGEEDLRRKFGEFAAECDDEALSRLVYTARREGATAELLSVVGGMSADAQRRVVQLPALEDQQVLVALVDAAAAGDHWDRLLPLVEFLDDGLRVRLAALVTEVDDEVLRAVVGIAQRDGRWSELLPLVGTMDDAGRRRVAGLVGELEGSVLKDVVDTAHSEGLWPQLLAVAEHLESNAIKALYGALGTPGGELLTGLVRAVDEHDLWRPLLSVLARQDASTQREIAPGFADLDPADRTLVEDKAERLGVAQALEPLREAVDSAGTGHR